MFFTAFPSGSLIHHYIFHKCSIFRQISGWDGLHWRPPQPKIWGGGVSPFSPPPRGLRPCDDLTKNWNHVSIYRVVCVCLGNFLWLIWCSWAAAALWFTSTISVRMTVEKNPPPVDRQDWRTNSLTFSEQSNGPVALWRTNQVHGADTSLCVSRCNRDSLDAEIIILST